MSGPKQRRIIHLCHANQCSTLQVTVGDAIAMAAGPLDMLPERAAKLQLMSIPETDSSRITERTGAQALVLLNNPKELDWQVNPKHPKLQFAKPNNQ